MYGFNIYTIYILLAVTTLSFRDFSSVSSTMPSIASDSEEPDLVCTKTAIGNPRISNHQKPHYNGTHQMDAEKIEIIDLISTMTLGHILRARSMGAELSPPPAY